MIIILYCFVDDFVFMSFLISYFVHVFFAIVNVFVRLLKLLAIAFNFKVMINDKIIMNNE